MGRKRLPIIRCKVCEADISTVFRPVWSDVIKKYFCNLDCYNNYKKAQKQALNCS